MNLEQARAKALPKRGTRKRLVLPPHPDYREKRSVLDTPTIMATVLVTALFCGIAYFMIPGLPEKGGEAPATRPTPIPPIGQSQPKPQQASPAQEAPAVAVDEMPPPQSPSRSETPDLATSQYSSQQPSPAPAQTASTEETKPSPPAHEAVPEKVAQAVQTALAEVATTAQANSPAAGTKKIANPASPPAPQPRGEGGEQDASALLFPAPEEPSSQRTAQPHDSAQQTAASLPQSRPITAVERAHVNALAAAAAIRSNDGRCRLVLTAVRPLKRYRWLQLDNPPRVAVDLIGIWDTKEMKRQAGGGQCVRAMRVGSHSDRVRVVLELAAISTGPPEVVVEKRSERELSVLLPAN